MRSVLFVLAALVCLGIANEEKPLVKLAFGSCNKQWLDQPMWKTLKEYDPDVFVWLGDVVYLDKMPFPLYFVPSSMERNREQYEKQKNNQQYRNFADSLPVVGVWDDHDYGLNNAGGDNEMKVEMRKMFLDFLGESKDSPRWTREGIYESYTYGPPGKKVKLILLDVRWARDPLGQTDGDILGEEQWVWFEKELKESDAQVHLIGSGTQVLPFDKPVIEKWSHFPTARKRLFDLLNRYETPGVVILSGDVHYGEMFKSEKTVLSYPLWEITSSGLSHSWYDDLNPKVFDFLSNLWLKSEYQVEEVYARRNFGSIEFYWDGPNPRLEFAIRDLNGTAVRTGSVQLKDLKPNKNVKISGEKILHRYTQVLTMESYLKPFIATAAVLGSLVLFFILRVVKRIVFGSSSKNMKKKVQ